MIMSESTQSKERVDITAKKIVAGWPKVGYDMENDAVRNFYSKYDGETKKRKSFFASKRLVDIFIFAMTLGKNAGIRKPYANKKDRRGGSIDIEYIATNPEYLWMMFAIAIEESNGALEIFHDPQTRIIDICEEYANYGINLLITMENDGTANDPDLGYENKINSLLKNLND